MSVPLDFLLGKVVSLYIYVLVCKGVNIHTHVCAHRRQEGVGSPGARVRGSCQPLTAVLGDARQSSAIAASAFNH